MKINETVENDYSNDNSEFYEAFKNHFDNVFKSRPIKEDGQKGYIKCVNTESAINSFLNYSTNELMVVKGAQGTGKTTTLYHMHGRFSKRKTCESLYIDLKKHSSLVPSSFQMSNDIDSKVSASIPKMRGLISSNFVKGFRSIVQENDLKYNDVLYDVFLYSFKHHFAIIPRSLRSSDLFHNRKEFTKKIKSKLHEDEDAGFHDAFYLVAYLYVLSKYMRIKKLVITVDSCDQLPYEIAEAVVFCASHFSECVKSKRIKGKKDHSLVLGKIRIYFIVPCRFHTYEKLIIRAYANALGSHSHELVIHKAEVSVGEIVAKRSKKTRKLSKYTFKNGITLNALNARKCIEYYFHQLDRSGCIDHLLEINNNNIAYTFDSLLSITKNKFFPKYDQLMEASEFVTKRDSGYTLPVNLVTTYECLVWGNPDVYQKTIYPPKTNNKIPNVYSWIGGYMSTFLFPIRIFLIMYKQGIYSSNSKMITVKSMFYLYNDVIDIDEALFYNCINSMIQQELLFSHAAQQVNQIGSIESITVSPKLNYIVNNIGRHNVFPIAFMEDVEIVEPHDTEIGVSIGKALRYQCKPVKFEILKYCLDLELAQFELMEKNGKIGNYSSIVNNRSIVALLYEGLKDDIKAYDEKTGASHRNEIKSKIEMINSKILATSGIRGMLVKEVNKRSTPYYLHVSNGMNLFDEHLDAETKSRILNEIEVIGKELSKNDKNKNIITAAYGRLDKAIKVGKNFDKLQEWWVEYGDTLKLAYPEILKLIPNINP